MANKKKIFDITPPQEALKSSSPTKTAKAMRRAKFKKIEVKKIMPKLPRAFRLRKPVLIIGGLLVIIILCLVFIESKAVIEIRPVKTPVEFSSQFSSAGEIIKKEHFISQEFPSSGQAAREDKAQGVIRVYNNYSLDQILVANTRFWCFDDENLREFKTKERVVVPAQQYLDVEVIASSAGEEYNIGPCTFSVPGLKGSPRYTSVYGESSSVMSGGKKTSVTQVTQADLDNAEKILEEKARQECQTALESAVSADDYIVIEEEMKIKVIEFIPLTEVGQVVNNFVCQIKVEGEVPVLKKSDLKDFARDYILSQIPTDKVLIEGSVGISYLPEAIDIENGQITLGIEISGEIYSALDENYLKEKVRDLRPDEIRATLRAFPEIEQVQARLWPFWVTTVPVDSAEIEVKVIVD